MKVEQYISLQFYADESVQSDLTHRRLSKARGLNVRLTASDAVTHAVTAGDYHVQEVNGWIVADDDCTWPRAIEVLLVPATRAQCLYGSFVGLDAILEFEAHAWRRVGRDGPIEWHQIDEDDDSDESNCVNHDDREEQ